jgi:putative oxidoreductase
MPEKLMPGTLLREKLIPARTFGGPGLVVSRCLLALLFLIEAWVKLNNYAMVVAYSEAHGVPSIMLPAAIALELGGGVLLVVGFATRIVALLFAGFCVVTAALFHTSFSVPGEALHFWKDLAIAGGMIALFFEGPGEWSVDHWLDANRRRRQSAAAS